jgi:hypothetical protein
MYNNVLFLRCHDGEKDAVSKQILWTSQNNGNETDRSKHNRRESDKMRWVLLRYSQQTEIDNGGDRNWQLIDFLCSLFALFLVTYLLWMFPLFRFFIVTFKLVESREEIIGSIPWTTFFIFYSIFLRFNPMSWQFLTLLELLERE